jgi:hypothetical protein
VLFFLVAVSSVTDVMVLMTLSQALDAYAQAPVQRSGSMGGGGPVKRAAGEFLLSPSTQGQGGYGRALVDVVETASPHVCLSLLITHYASCH